MAISLLIRRATASVATLFMSRVSSIMPSRARAQVDFEARFEAIEAREELRSVLTDLARIVDAGLVSDLSKLRPRLHASFTMRVVDIAGTERRLVGVEGLVDGYSPMMAPGRGRLIWSAVSVDLDGDRATAWFKLAGAVEPSPKLGLPAGPRVLLMSANTARLMREGAVWKLASLELIHSMAYPGIEQTMPATKPRKASMTQVEARPKSAKTTKTTRSRKRAAKS
jgi:hypothetical protein